MSTERVQLADGVADQGIIPGVAAVPEAARLIAEAQMARARHKPAAIGHGPLFEPVQPDLLTGRP